MTITRKLTAITTAIALAATTLGSVTTSASAHDWRDGNGGGRQYARNYDGGRDFRRSDDRDWGRHEGRNRYYARHRHHDNTGKYIALGVGALMLGILASEASHR